jgi:hypothetical protein
MAQLSELYLVPYDLPFVSNLLQYKLKGLISLGIGDLDLAFGFIWFSVTTKSGAR